MIAPLSAGSITCWHIMRISRNGCDHDTSSFIEKIDTDYLVGVHAITTAISIIFTFSSKHSNILIELRRVVIRADRRRKFTQRLKYEFRNTLPRIQIVITPSAHVPQPNKSDSLDRLLQDLQCSDSHLKSIVSAKFALSLNCLNFRSLHEMGFNNNLAIKLIIRRRSFRVLKLLSASNIANVALITNSSI